ncbi:MAG: tyrosine-type recombinase/integrase [Geobacteraceae bacterium]
MGKKKDGSKEASDRVTDSTLGWGNGSIVTKRGSSRLYYDFVYFGERVEISCKLKDTPANRVRAREWLDRQMLKIKDGTFRFGEAFPGASSAKITHFSALEGTEVLRKPQHVTLREYTEGEWFDKVWANQSHSTKGEDKAAVHLHILPFFGDKTFFEINSTEMGLFIKSRKHRKGPKKGCHLSRSRIENVLLPLRNIWGAACDRYRWDLPDPFKKTDEQLPPNPKEILQDECMPDENGNIPEIQSTIDTLRFDEYAVYLSHIDAWYKPILELWVLTGIIPSEMAGLTRYHIKNGFIHIRRSISKGVEKQSGKTKNRRRDITITEKIQSVLDVLINRSRGRRIATLKGGKPLTSGEFYKAWREVEKDHNLRHRRPYSLRHTFAAWSLVIGVDKIRLVSLMGHGSKEMVFEVYGNYTKGLEHDREKIMDYFGRDFVAGENNETPESQIAKEFAKSGASISATY